jgi:hypothetical protein
VICRMVNHRSGAGNNVNSAAHAKFRTYSRRA